MCRRVESDESAVGVPLEPRLPLRVSAENTRRRGAGEASVEEKRDPAIPRISRPRTGSLELFPWCRPVVGGIDEPVDPRGGQGLDRGRGVSPVEELSLEAVAQAEGNYGLVRPQAESLPGPCGETPGEAGGQLSERLFLMKRVGAMTTLPDSEGAERGRTRRS